MARFSFYFFVIFLSGFLFCQCISKSKIETLASEVLLDRKANFYPVTLNPRIESIAIDSSCLVKNYCHCEVKDRLFIPVGIFYIARNKIDCKIEGYNFMNVFIKKLNDLVEKENLKNKNTNKVALKFLQIPTTFKLDYRTVYLLIPISPRTLFFNFDGNSNLNSPESQLVLSYKIFGTNKENEEIVLKEGFISKTLEDYTGYKDEFEYRRTSKFVKSYLKILDERKLELINSTAIEIHNLILKTN